MITINSYRYFLSKTINKSNRDRTSVFIKSTRRPINFSLLNSYLPNFLKIFPPLLHLHGNQNYTKQGIPAALLELSDFQTIHVCLI